MTEPAALNTLRLRPLTPQLGAEILGRQAATVDDPQSALFRAVYRAFLDHQLLLFRDQRLAPGAQVAFARCFGEVQIHVMDQYHAADHPELYTLSNLDGQGRPNGRHPDRGTLAWHTDGSWRPVTGQATILYAVEIPAEGGETHFCDMYGAYRRLSGEQKRALEGRRAVHNLAFSRQRRHGEDPLSDAQRAAVPPVAHPILRRHPETGRRCVYLGDHAETVEGMDYQTGRELVETLNAAVVHDDLVYRHRWRPGDLMIWDNRCLLHRATAYDTARERRVIRRCTVLGEAPQA